VKEALKADNKKAAAAKVLNLGRKGRPSKEDQYAK
jgi:hypothetical protein